MDIFIFFALGAVLGSFYNVVGIRIPEGHSIVKPRSSCPACKRVLGSFDLIPVLSYLLSLGKCRSCKTRISPVYPIFEFLTGTLLAFGYYKFGLTWEYLSFTLVSSLLVIITVSDLYYKIVPDSVLLVFGIPLIAVELYTSDSLTENFIGLGAAFAIMLLILLFSKGQGIGGGDVKLYMILGLSFGWQIFALLFILSVYIGLIHATVQYLITKDRVIPFVPSIAIGTIAAFLYHRELIDWYIQYLM